jgi:hypothetical protein
MHLLEHDFLGPSSIFARANLTGVIACVGVHHAINSPGQGYQDISPKGPIRLCHKIPNLCFSIWQLYIRPFQEQSNVGSA